MRQPNPTSTSVGRSAATLLALGCAGIAVAQSVLYVSPSGRDEWSGTMKYATRNRTDGPKKTMAGARDAIRLLKAQGLLDPKGAIVYLASGTYPVTSTITFDSRDSGTAEGPIVYRAQVQGKAILDGGRKLTIWTSVSPSVAAYLKPEVRNKVMQCRLGQLRLTRANAGEMIRRGAGEEWSKACPAFLVWDGRKMPLARFPSTGFLLTSTAGSASQFSTNYPGAKRWSFPGNDPWVKGYFVNNYECNGRKASSIDENLLVSLDAPVNGGTISAGHRYYFENVLEELDSPGEWFVDRDNMVIYFYPPLRSQLASKASLVTFADTLVTIYPNVKGTAMHLRFEGLLFNGNRTAASSDMLALVSGRYAPTDVAFYGCTFRCSARAGVSTGYPTSGYSPDRWTFDSCDFTDIGGSGIVMYGGDKATLRRAGSLVRNCLFERICQDDVGAVGVAVTCNDSVGVTIQNCEFRNLKCEGVNFGVYTTVERCLFDNVCDEMGDAAAVHAGRITTVQGSVIRNNVIRNVRAYDPAWLNGVSGIYLDDNSCGVQVVDNVVENCDIGFSTNSIRDNLVSNNVFKDCAKWAISLSELWGVWGGDVEDPASMRYKARAALRLVNPDQQPWLSAFPYMLDVVQRVDGALQLSADAMNARRNVFSHNLYLSAPLVYKTTFGAAVSTDDPNAGFYATSNYAGDDPGFVDFPRSLSLTPGASASAVGFVPWDVSKVGLVRSEWRSL